MTIQDKTKKITKILEILAESNKTMQSLYTYFGEHTEISPMFVEIIWSMLEWLKNDHLAGKKQEWLAKLDRVSDMIAAIRAQEQEEQAEHNLDDLLSHI